MGRKSNCFLAMSRAGKISRRGSQLCARVCVREVAAP